MATECDDWDSLESEDYDESEEFGCCDPENCIAQGLHYRSECHTAEDMEAYYEECRREEQQTERGRDE